MSLLRILIIDGASAMRQAISVALRKDARLDVVGAMASGMLALARLEELRPDVVLLDVAEDREGLQTLARLRESQPTLPIIIFSQLASRGSQVTVDALMLGATAYVTKPVSNAELDACVSRELIPKINAVAGSSPEKPARVSRPVVASDDSFVRPRAELVAIATSTGGPKALSVVLSSLPASFSTPIVIVQHMAMGFTAGLAESLRRQAGRDVREVNASQPLQAAPIWLAAGGRHLVLARDGGVTHVRPDNSPLENECRPSADVLFRSIVEIYGSRCLVVVLTGMGCDGLSGCRSIRQAGGQIIVQDEASSVAWGMPGQVASAGLADAVVPLTGIANEIMRRVRGGESMTGSGHSAVERRAGQ